MNDVRTALEAERLSVALDRNDVALRAGRHAELLGELAAALHAHPLDERLAGQLMLAQYRSGRQADALDTYRQMRDRLVDELGVDPSPALRRVHQQILDGDQRLSALRAAGARASADRPPSPICHGARLASSAASERCCASAAALREGPLVTLTGVGGVGKTRLALEAAAARTGALR